MKVLCLGGLQGMEALQTAFSLAHCDLVPGDDSALSSLGMNVFDGVLFRLSRNTSTCHNSELIAYAKLFALLCNDSSKPYIATPNNKDACEKNAGYRLIQYVSPVIKK